MFRSKVLIYKFHIYQMSKNKKVCCVPRRKGLGLNTTVDSPEQTIKSLAGSKDGMIQVEAGKYSIGFEGPEAWESDGEGPVREITLDNYWLDQTAVSNAQFAEFIDDTGYVTQSETFGWAHVFIGQLSNSKQRKLRESNTVRGLQWWYAIEGAYWRKPEGPGSTIKKRMDHPVVSISWNDATAYASWAGKRLPTEAEWERAARGGLERKPFAWGDVFAPQGEDVWMANIWQGLWPYENTSEDGFAYTAPVKSFPPNAYGLYDMAGNVWEIVADRYHPKAYSQRIDGAINPTGPNAYSLSQLRQRLPTYVTRGGSFLCSDGWCSGYQPGSRQALENDSPAHHTGFRCVKDAD